MSRNTHLAAASLLLVLLTTGCELLQPRPKKKEEPQGKQTQPAAKPQQKQTQRPGRSADGRSYILDPRYRPLEAIVERPPLPGMSSTAATTISPKVYVVSLDRWLKKHPPGTPLFESVMRHEQLHAKRQEAYPGGVDPWVKRYLNDTAFMWAEEQLGWFEHIKHLRYGGLQVKPEGVAKNLSNYSNLKGQMVSYDEALRWTKQVLANQWRPPR